MVSFSRWQRLSAARIEKAVRASAERSGAIVVVVMRASPRASLSHAAAPASQGRRPRRRAGVSCGRRGPGARSAPRCGRRSARPRPGPGSCGAAATGGLGDPLGQRADRQAVLDAGHGLAPDLGRQAAAGGAGERRVVVVAHPDAGDVVGGEADEPGVAGGLGGAGLAGGGAAVGQRRAGAGAVVDHLAHHPDELARRLLVDHPHPRPGPALHQRRAVGLAAELGQAVGRDPHPLGEEAGIGAGHLEQRRLGDARAPAPGRRRSGRSCRSPAPPRAPARARSPRRRARWRC